MSNYNNNEESNSVQIHKPYSKYRDQDKEFNFNFKMNMKNSLPYFIVVFIFVLSLYFVFILFDGIIMPALVHNKDMVKVPDLAGKSVEESSRILTKKNLAYKVVQEVYSEELPAQFVIKQSPYSKLIVKEGRTIYLTVSKGKEVVGVPMLIGLPISKVRVELMKFGLELGEINYEENEFIGKDTVVSQSISNGKMVPFGSIVNVVASLGSNVQIEVPSLLGLRFEEAQEILITNGFIVGSISYQTNETFTPNTIISQSPEPGDFTPKQSIINIIISK